MQILSAEPFTANHLLSALRETRLVGHGGVQLYWDSSLSVSRCVDPDLLAPAQRYVLTPNVEKILELHEAMERMGVDIFDLDGGFYVATSENPGERVPVLPPIVEESLERGGRTVLLISDGMHRVFAARSAGKPVTVVVVRDVPAQYPYYAYALEEGWRGVRQFTELPDGFQKKEYRRPEGYKALFRDYNGIFPGVQKQRKNSNPTHIRA